MKSLIAVSLLIGCMYASPVDQNLFADNANEESGYPYQKTEIDQKIESDNSQTQLDLIDELTADTSEEHFVGNDNDFTTPAATTLESEVTDVTTSVYQEYASVTDGLIIDLSALDTVTEVDVKVYQQEEPSNIAQEESTKREQGKAEGSVKSSQPTSFFPIYFGSYGRSEGSAGVVSVANSYSTGRGGVAISHATAYGGGRTKFNE